MKSGLYDMDCRTVSVENYGNKTVLLRITPASKKATIGLDDNGGALMRFPPASADLLGSLLREAAAVEGNDTPKYVLKTDSDGHWYVIPADKQEEWSKWCDVDDGDPKGWTPPSWAHQVGGAPSLVTFSNFKIG